MLTILNEQELIEKWTKEDLKGLSVASIADPEIRVATARLLENIENTSKRAGDPLGLLTEATTVAPTSQATGQFQPISLAVARRVNPELFAWKTVGVQPMSGPVGLAYAMRFRYNGYQHEAAFDNLNLWNTFTGNLSGTSGATPGDAGVGVATATAEAWGIGHATTPMPQLVYAMESVAITAISRKLAASVSIESMQDVQAMHGIDLKRELTNKLQYQVKAEIDREILAAIKAAAIDTAVGGETITTWQTSAADGRWSMEKYQGLVNAIIAKGNEIGNSTRVDAANFVVVSTRIASILQSIPDKAIFTAAYSTANPTNSFAEIGVLNGRMKVYVDRYAVSDYATVGLKGADGQNECGVIYSPYTLGVEAQATDPYNFNQNIGTMSRYALTRSLLGAGRYYRTIQAVGLSSIIQV